MTWYRVRNNSRYDLAHLTHQWEARRRSEQPRWISYTHDGLRLACPEADQFLWNAYSSVRIHVKRTLALYSFRACNRTSRSRVSAIFSGGVYGRLKSLFNVHAADLWRSAHDCKSWLIARVRHMHAREEIRMRSAFPASFRNRGKTIG